MYFQAGGHFLVPDFLAAICSTSPNRRNLRELLVMVFSTIRSLLLLQLVPPPPPGSWPDEGLAGQEKCQNLILLMASPTRLFYYSLNLPLLPLGERRGFTPLPFSYKLTAGLTHRTNRSRHVTVFPFLSCCICSLHFPGVWTLQTSLLLLLCVAPAAQNQPQQP